MTTQSRVYAAALSLSILIGPGAIALGAAEPHSVLHDDPDVLGQDDPAIEPTAVPACDLPWASLGEHDVSSAGSEPFGDVPDGWADAYADGSRISSSAVMAQAYPVTLNPQVQFFLDRFTGSRRDAMTLWVSRS